MSNAPHQMLLSYSVLSAALWMAMTSASDAQALEENHPVQNLPTLTVIGKTNQGSMRPGALRDELVKTESIGEKAINRADATNINEAVDKNPGIAVQVECSICNVRNIVLNNLPGRYTTLMIDGVPIFSSVSSAYGLDSVSVYGVERIDISRGAGASLIAPEALSGAVNIVTKHPTQKETRLRYQIGSFGSRQADVYLAQPFSGGAVTATANYNTHNSVDADGNKISEYTGYDRRQGGFGFFLDDIGGFQWKGRVDFVKEKRGGGALGRDYATIKSSGSGNPFLWNRGVHASPNPNGWVDPTTETVLPYDGGLGGFSEIIFTHRSQVISTAERAIGAGKLRLAFGAASHRQDSFYEVSTYLGQQKQYYSEVSWQMPIGYWLVTTGANFRYENLHSHGRTDTGVPVSGVDNYTYRVPAVFAQVYRAFWNDLLEINGSVRYDKHNIFGGIFSPRMNVLYHHTPQLSSRLSLGEGFRAPTSFFEQDHGILDTIRIERRIRHPENSHNVSYAINYANDRFSITSSYNFNRIKNFALLDPSQVDAQGNPVTLFTSARRPVIVNGIDINSSYLITPALSMTLGAEGNRYQFPPGTLVFARPKVKGYFGLDYERFGWDLSTKMVWTGPMNLQQFHNVSPGYSSRYNLDGTPKRHQSPSFATVDVNGEYAFNQTWSLFIGANNLFNYRQSDHESAIFVDEDGRPDVVHLWGPSRGRYLYAGIKVNL